MGYVEYTVVGAAPTGVIAAGAYSGAIVPINRDAGYRILRDEADREHRIDVGRDAGLTNLAVGDRVNIRVTDERR